MPFKAMGLADPLVQGILATGYTAPTEIQSQAIPAILDGKDIIGCAQTGTGKTAAFVLPILNRLETVPKKSKKKKARALVLTPTRELAVQIETAIKGYGRCMDLHTISVYGGTRIDAQIRHLRRGVDVIVATPGRLLDHINRGTINLSLVEMLVLDEADRMLDMGFIHDIRQIVNEIPAKRQTLLFSATMANEVKKLTETIQNKPKTIQIGRQHNPIETITQHILPVPQDQKMDLLLHLIENEAMGSMLIFSRTKHGADKICRKLSKSGVEAVAIHSDRTQAQRLRALDGFRRGQYQVMVATDIAARGINVEGISHVINYDVPGYAEDYVHRIGRTGRAAATGDAMTFVAQDEVLNLRKIEKFIECKFEPEMIEGFSYSYKVDLNAKIAGKKSGGGGRGRGQRSRSSKPGKPSWKKSDSSSRKTSDSRGKSASKDKAPQAKAGKSDKPSKPRNKYAAGDTKTAEGKRPPKKKKNAFAKKKRTGR